MIRWVLNLARSRRGTRQTDIQAEAHNLDSIEISPTNSPSNESVTKLDDQIYVSEGNVKVETDQAISSNASVGSMTSLRPATKNQSAQSDVEMSLETEENNPENSITSGTKKLSADMKKNSSMRMLGKALDGYVTKIMKKKPGNLVIQINESPLKIEEGQEKTDVDMKSEEKSQDEYSTKIQQLQQIFPYLKESTISKILKEHKGHVEKAMDDLLKQPHDTYDLEQRPMTAGSSVAADLLQESSTGSNDGAAISSTDLRHLIEWGQTGGEEAEYQAAVALADLSILDQNQRKLMNHALDLVLKLLSSKSEDIQRYSLCAVANLALNVENQRPFLDKGFLPVLTNAMANGSNATKEETARTIANLCYQNEYAEDLIFKEGVVPNLVKSIEQGHTQLQCEALAALANLSRNSQIQGMLLKSEGCNWPAVLLHLRSNNEDLQNQAARFHANISIHPDNKKIIVENGGLPPLLYCLQMGGKTGRRLAMMAFANLSTLEENRSKIIDAGAALPIMGMLSKETEDQLQACRALCNIISSCDDDVKLHLVQKGLMGHIMALTEADVEVDLQILAAKILRSLVSSVQGLSSSW